MGIWYILETFLFSSKGIPNIHQHTDSHPYTLANALQKGPGTRTWEGTSKTPYIYSHCCSLIDWCADSTDIEKLQSPWLPRLVKRWTRTFYIHNIPLRPIYTSNLRIKNDTQQCPRYPNSLQQPDQNQQPAHGYILKTPSQEVSQGGRGEKAVKLEKVTYNGTFLKEYMVDWKQQCRP